MPPLPSTDLLLGLALKVLLPALAASALVLALLLLMGKDKGASLGAALAVTAGFAAGNYFREVLPWYPEQLGWHCLPVAIVTVLAAELLARLPVIPETVGLLLRASGYALAASLLVPADLRIEKAWIQPAFLVVVLAEGELLRKAAEGSPGGGVPLVLSLTFLGAAIVLIHAPSALLADIALMGAASFAGIAVPAWWKRADVAAALPGAAVLLPGLLLSGYHATDIFSDVPWVCFALVALAPLALVLAQLPPVAWLNGRSFRLIQFGLLLTPVIAAVIWAMRASPLEPMDFE